VVADETDPSTGHGTLALVNIYKGRKMRNVAPGTVKNLLVYEVLPAPVNYAGAMSEMSAGGTFSVERLIGTVPVSVDGSARFRLPPVRSFLFLAMDEKGHCVKRMHSFTSVMPGETTTCIGCHEHRTEAPSADNSRLRSADFVDGLTNTFCAAEVKAYTPYYRNTTTATATTPSTPADIAALCTGGQAKMGPDLMQNTGHTEWVDGRASHIGFTTTFTPNAVVPFSYGGQTYDIDFSSQKEGASTTNPTYTANTARSYHAGIVHAVMMDCSIHAVSDSIDRQLWRSLSTRAGGEPVSFDGS